MQELSPSKNADCVGDLNSLLALVEDVGARQFVGRTHQLLIDGQWRSASDGGTVDVVEPSTGARMGAIAAASAADVDAAVASARRAFVDGRWSRLPASDRERRLHVLADLLAREADALAAIESLDNGKPLATAREVDVPDAIAWNRYVAGWPTRIDGRTVPLSAPNAPLGLTLREPVGVVAAITPWNFPLAMAVQKVTTALAAGCTVVLKPAEQTSLTALRLGELALEAGIPEGVFNVLTGIGADAGSALVAHPDVAKISFTGSTATGVHIGKTAMDRMARVTLELGGKSPMIVLPDCDLDKAAQGVIDGLFFNAGQVCCAAARLYAHEAIYEDLLERVATRVAELKLGHGLLADTDMGPLVSAAQRDRVRRFIDHGGREGGRQIGGGVWDGPGWFVRPTIFSDLPADSRLIREEIFGPVIVAASFRTTEEAVRLANDTQYGLAASIWSNDLARVRELAGQIRAGTVWVNAHNPVDAAMPFGGMGHSGFGREGGPEGLEAYLETKAIWIA